MFKYKNAAELAKMSEYELEKYQDEKAKHEAALAETKGKEAGEKSGKEAADKAVDEAKIELNKTIDAQKEEISALKVSVDEMDKKYEKALTDMNKIKASSRGEDSKNMQTEILEALTAKDSEGRRQIENYSKAKTPVNFEITGKNVLKAPGVIGVTAGTTQQEWVAPIGIPHEQTQARDIIPIFSTNRDTIKYVQFTKKDGSIGSVDPGALKPQIDYNSTPKTAPVIKIAGWVTTQEEFLDDVDGAAEWLAQELPWAYKDEETRQVFKGNGTAATPDELTGLYSLVATAVNYSGTVNAASNRWDKIAMALTNTRRALRPGDAIWTSPEDYMELLINKSTGATAIYDYPIQAGTNGQLYIGGIPIYYHNTFNPGEGLAGNFKRGVALFQRKAITLRTSTEHDQNFTHNLVTWLIEARVAMPVFFPESFKKINFNITT